MVRKSSKPDVLVVLAFVLPIGFIGAIALNAYLPAFLLSTDYDFVYLYCTDGPDYHDYDCGDYMAQHYAVVDGRLAVNPVKPTLDRDGDGVADADDDTVRVFLHDTAHNTSREITLDRAHALVLSPLLTSPDGVSFSYQHDRGPDFLFFIDGGWSHGYYLSKGGNRVRQHLIAAARPYDRNSLRFLGWVLPAENK